MTLPAPSPNPTVYMQGTRRLDEMAANARQLCYQEDYSYTEGWNDNTVAEIANLGLNQIYDRITQINQVANIQEYRQDVLAGIQEYDIPQDVKMGLQTMNVRYLYGPQDWQFVTLQQTGIEDRFSYPTNIPSTFCIRNGKMLLSPTPNISRTGSLIVNYQKRMRSLDFRRGKVTNITSPFGNVVNISNSNPAVVTTEFAHGLTTGMKVGLGGDFQPSFLINTTSIITVLSPTTFSLNGVDTSISNPFSGAPIWYQNPVQFTLNFTVTSQKDVNLKANADSILDKVDWITFVDRNGVPVIDAIPINSYDMINNRITCDANYVIPFPSWSAFQALINNQDTVYVVTGDYASTHSELDRQTEDLLVEYMVLRLLRLQSAAEPTKDQLYAESQVMDRLAIAYRRYRPSINKIQFQQTQRSNFGYMGGRGAY
jgi:hypothetical protein